MLPAFSRFVIIMVSSYLFKLASFISFCSVFFAVFSVVFACSAWGVLYVCVRDSVRCVLSGLLFLHCFLFSGVLFSTVLYFSVYFLFFGLYFVSSNCIFQNILSRLVDVLPAYFQHIELFS